MVQIKNKNMRNNYLEWKRIYIITCLGLIKENRQHLSADRGPILFQVKVSIHFWVIIMIIVDNLPNYLCLRLIIIRINLVALSEMNRYLEQAKLILPKFLQVNIIHFLPNNLFLDIINYHYQITFFQHLVHSNK
jgi:hypothetical protein